MEIVGIIIIIVIEYRFHIRRCNKYNYFPFSFALIAAFVLFFLFEQEEQHKLSIK